ncbi:hypothetical protein F4680DRAFT_446641 [Xylaria scruposa]|nr:hypothetical protein F4680DRAFT_446641 [Xylaria scruposa]
MDNFVKDAENAVESNMSKDAQPGNSFEKAADNYANQEVDKYASEAGVPQQDDNAVNEFVDKEVNQEIPGGNN